MATQHSIKVQELGDLLRYWRQQRGKSQLDLSLDTGISQRHLSFVESGRSTPSRDLLSTVSEALDIPLRERNVLLLASGYAPLYNESAWEAPEMAAITRTIDRVLLQHEPHPALVLDRYWNVIRTNAAAPQFFGSFIDLTAREHPRNLLHLMFDPTAMRPFIENWDEVAAGLLQRVRRESLGHVVDEKTIRLLNELKNYPGVKDLSSVPRAQSPVLPITFRKGAERFSYFSLITTVGTPQCITAQELRIECMFPMETNQSVNLDGSAAHHLREAEAGTPNRTPHHRLSHLFHEGWRPTSLSIASGYRAPCTSMPAKASSISSRSSEVSSTSTAPRFSSKRWSLVVPGIGTIQYIGDLA